MQELVALKISSHWAMIYNKFAVANPISKGGKITNYDHFCENILVLQQIRFNGEYWHVDKAGYCIDLSWLPVADPQGKYHLKLLKGSADNVVVEISSKNRDRIRLRIEKMIECVDKGMLPDEISALFERIY